MGRKRCLPPDGMRLATGSSDRTARVWDIATAGPIGLPLEGHGKRVTSVAFSPDGTRLVTGSDDRTAQVWDTATGVAITRLDGLTCDWRRSVRSRWFYRPPSASSPASFGFPRR
ncbi:WD40 repeat domain-containing protein [Paracoccus sp. J39]|uniref:WD40 repeat domain-containing protein n=1 Tax=Paracoccus sp. J39 TaxID=935848 RepID=UPI0035289CCA